MQHSSKLPRPLSGRSGTHDIIQQLQATAQLKPGEPTLASVKPTAGTVTPGIPGLLETMRLMIQAAGVVTESSEQLPRLQIDQEPVNQTTRSPQQPDAPAAYLGRHAEPELPSCGLPASQGSLTQGLQQLHLERPSRSAQQQNAVQNAPSCLQQAYLPDAPVLPATQSLTVPQQQGEAEDASRASSAGEQPAWEPSLAQQQPSVLSMPEVLVHDTASDEPMTGQLAPGPLGQQQVQLSDEPAPAVSKAATTPVSRPQLEQAALQQPAHNDTADVTNNQDTCIGHRMPATLPLIEAIMQAIYPQVRAACTSLWQARLGPARVASGGLTAMLKHDHTTF